MQSRAVSSTPMSFKVTRLLFWYVLPLSENLMPPAPRKEEVLMLYYLCIGNLFLYIKQWYAETLNSRKEYFLGIPTVQLYVPTI